MSTFVVGNTEETQEFENPPLFQWSAQVFFPEAECSPEQLISLWILVLFFFCELRQSAVTFPLEALLQTNMLYRQTELAI